jgi:hypothetical protein
LKEKIMKNSIAILSLSALAAASVQTASAGDREWATVGKILTGVAAAHVIAHAVQPAPVYAMPPAPVVLVSPSTPVYCAPPAPVVVQPQPVCVVPSQVVVVPRYYRVAPPLISFNFGHGHRHHARRHCW